MSKPAWLAFALVTGWICISSAENVVGLKESYSDAYLAVRVKVPAGTTIHGIRFFSNDATLFPEVLLAVDMLQVGLPRNGSVLRSASAVSATPGYPLCQHA